MEENAEEIGNTSEIGQLFESDQQDRQIFVKDPAKGLEIRKRDEKRLARAKEIVAKEEISDSNELNMLALIFLHGDTAEDYQKALELTTKAVELGLSPKDSLISQATDRLMIQEQLDRGVPPKDLKQKYGTQVRFDETGQTIKPPLDGTVSQEEFEKFGIS